MDLRAVMRAARGTEGEIRRRRLSAKADLPRVIDLAILGEEDPRVVVCSGRSGSTKCPVRPSLRPSVPPSVQQVSTPRHFYL
mgnify:CR=1 FL=1